MSVCRDALGTSIEEVALGHRLLHTAKNAGSPVTLHGNF